MIAEVAAASGLSPREVEVVADDDPVMFATWRSALAEHWSVDTELLAGTMELAHSHIRQAMAASGVKKYDLPDPLRVPRPNSVEPEKPPVVTGGKLKQWMNSRKG